MSFQVPGKSSVNADEFRPKPYVVPFAPELIDFVVKNQKLTTYRFGLKYDYLRVGDKVSIQNSATKKIVGTARIKSKNRVKFSDLPIDDGSHESHRDKEHQRQVLSGYYAYLGRPIADDDIFLVIKFQLC